MVESTWRTSTVPRRRRRWRTCIGLYSIGLDAGDTFVAMIGCPRLAEGPAYLGHMANDASHAPGQSRRQQKLAPRQINAEFCNIASAAHKAVVALKHIPRGDRGDMPLRGWLLEGACATG